MMWWLICVVIFLLLALLGMAVSVYQWCERPMDYLGPLDGDRSDLP